MQFIVSGSILFLPPYTRGKKKNIWSGLEFHPGPLASQATTRPLLLGLYQFIMRKGKKKKEKQPARLEPMTSLGVCSTVVLQTLPSPEVVIVPDEVRIFWNPELDGVRLPVEVEEAEAADETDRQ